MLQPSDAKAPKIVTGVNGSWQFHKRSLIGLKNSIFYWSERYCQREEHSTFKQHVEGVIEWSSGLLVMHLLLDSQQLSLNATVWPSCDSPARPAYYKN